MSTNFSGELRGGQKTGISAMTSGISAKYQANKIRMRSGAYAVTVNRCRRNNQESESPITRSTVSLTFAIGAKPRR